MERTGHRSLEVVRDYKRTSHTKSVALSDILKKINKKKPVLLTTKF